jgi:hypothetical protein
MRRAPFDAKHRLAAVGHADATVDVAARLVVLLDALVFVFVVITDRVVEHTRAGHQLLGARGTAAWIVERTGERCEVRRGRPAILGRDFQALAHGRIELLEPRERLADERGLIRLHTAEQFSQRALVGAARGELQREQEAHVLHRQRTEAKLGAGRSKAAGRLRVEALTRVGREQAEAERDAGQIDEPLIIGIGQPREHAMRVGDRAGERGDQVLGLAQDRLFAGKVHLVALAAHEPCDRILAPHRRRLGEHLAASGRIFFVDHDLDVDVRVAGVPQQSQQQPPHAGLAAGPAIGEVHGCRLEHRRAQVRRVCLAPPAREQLGGLRDQPLALGRRRQGDVLGLRVGAEHAGCIARRRCAADGWLPTPWPTVITWTRASRRVQRPRRRRRGRR